MKKPRLLSAGEAKNSLMARMARVKDRASQIEVRLGMRPYEVHLVWTKWTGDERGDGVQRIVCRMPLLPVPKVEDMSISRNPFAAGRYPVGSVRVSSISTTYTRELLEGRVLPEKRELEVPEPYDFFWEIVEDGRHGTCPLRRRFQPTAEPSLDAENQQWIVVLEKQSGDMERNGQPQDDPVIVPPDPWITRRIEGPDDED
jgi:hypothetical protein